MTRGDLAYNRDVLVNVLVFHYRADIKGCGCGWSDLGRSHPEHVATVYEQSVAAHSATQTLPSCPSCFTVRGRHTATCPSGDPR